MREDQRNRQQAESRLSKEGYGTKGLATGGNWIGDAVPKSHRGELHEALGVPQDKTISASRLETAAHSSNSHMRHMAQFAKNVKG